MISQPDMLKIEALLETATDKQMSEIAQMFNEIRNKKTAAKARTFKVGQKVRWHGKRGYMEGVIEKVNKKNIIVDVETSKNCVHSSPFLRVSLTPWLFPQENNCNLCKGCSKLSLIENALSVRNGGDTL